MVETVEASYSRERGNYTNKIIYTTLIINTLMLKLPKQLLFRLILEQLTLILVYYK